MSNPQPEFTFWVINVTFLTIFAMFIMSLWREARMVKCKKSAPKPLTDEGRLQKNTKWKSKKWPQTLRLSVKKWVRFVKSTTGIHFFSDKRNVLGRFCDVRFVTLESSGNGKVQKVSSKASAKGNSPWYNHPQPRATFYQLLDLPRGNVYPHFPLFCFVFLCFPLFSLVSHATTTGHFLPTPRPA